MKSSIEFNDEIEPGINHNIDELLVGIVKQIRGKRKKKSKTTVSTHLC